MIYSQCKDIFRWRGDTVVMAQNARRKIFLREWRKHRRLTQEQLGERMGRETGDAVSNAHISHIETGRQQYTQDMLERLADALNCEPYDLLIGPPDRLEELRAITALIPPEERSRAAHVLSAFMARTPVKHEDAA